MRTQIGSSRDFLTQPECLVLPGTVVKLIGYHPNHPRSSVQPKLHEVKCPCCDATSFLQKPTVGPAAGHSNWPTKKKTFGAILQVSRIQLKNIPKSLHPLSKKKETKKKRGKEN